MRYFTPELIVRLNSKGVDLVQVHQEWEDAIDAYQKHLKEVDPRMSTGVRSIARTLCLHDAEYCDLIVHKSFWAHERLAFLIMRKGPTSVGLEYLLAEEPLICNVPDPWPFSRENVHWLYDEFDVDAQGRQRHDILLSDGRLLTFIFFDVQLLLKNTRAGADVA